MPLQPLKENATQEEINAWIVSSMEEYEKLENNLNSFMTNHNENEKRIKELEQANQKLFLKVTTKVTDEKEEDEIPNFISKEIYGLLSEKDKKLIWDIERGEDE